MDFITNENSLPKQVVINKDNIEILQANMEIVDADSAQALSYATAAITKADTAYDLASSVEGEASEAKSIATIANTTANTANANANTAIALANTNKEAIEALGDLDAEAIANLTANVDTLVAQVDAAEDDITNMKVTITSNTTLATRANNVADIALDTGNEALTKANDNAQSIVSLGDDILDLEKAIGTIEGNLDYVPYSAYSYQDVTTATTLMSMLNYFDALTDYGYIDIYLESTYEHTRGTTNVIRWYPGTGSKVSSTSDGVIIQGSLFTYGTTTRLVQPLLGTSGKVEDISSTALTGSITFATMISSGWAVTAKAYRERSVNV